MSSRAWRYINPVVVTYWILGCLVSIIITRIRSVHSVCIKQGTGYHEEQREELLDMLSHRWAGLYIYHVLELSSHVLLSFM